MPCICRFYYCFCWCWCSSSTVSLVFFLSVLIFHSLCVWFCIFFFSISHSGCLCFCYCFFFFLLAKLTLFWVLKKVLRSLKAVSSHHKHLSIWIFITLTKSLTNWLQMNSTHTLSAARLFFCFCIGRVLFFRFGFNIEKVYNWVASFSLIRDRRFLFFRFEFKSVLFHFAYLLNEIVSECVLRAPIKKTEQMTFNALKLV